MNENWNNLPPHLHGLVRSIPLNTGHEYLDSFHFVYVLDHTVAISHAWIMPAESLPHVTTPDRQPHVVAVAVERVEAAIAAWGRRDSTAFDHLTLTPARTDFAAHAREAMCAIPFGSMATYGDLAAEIGNPRASRAIGTACAQNPIPLIVPCHRVVPHRTVDAMRQRGELRAKNGGTKDGTSGVAVGAKDGNSVVDNRAENSELAGLERFDVGNYAIGSELKYALLEFEGALS